MESLRAVDRLGSNRPVSYSEIGETLLYPIKRATDFCSKPAFFRAIQSLFSCCGRGVSMLVR